MSGKFIPILGDPSGSMREVLARCPNLLDYLAHPTRVYRPFIYDRDTGDLVGDYSRLESLLDPEELKVTFGDDGIGSYEFWGFRGYDSRPYVSLTEESDVGEWVRLIVDSDRETDLDEAGLKRMASEFLEGMDTSYSRDCGDDYHDGPEADAKMVVQDIIADVPNQTVRFYVTWEDA